MSYYKDLTSYNYRHHSKKELNVGWLQEDQPFEVGETPEGFLDKLKNFSNFRMFQTKGWQSCHFCDENEHSSNEIRVVSNEGVYYASPMMIIHYVEAHKYLPPEEFIIAVMEGPEPDSEEYKTAIAMMPNYWEMRQPDPNDEDYEEKMAKIMTNGITEAVDTEIMKDVMNESPELKTFIEGYNKVMPAVYGFNKKKDDSEKKS